MTRGMYRGSVKVMSPTDSAKLSKENAVTYGLRRNGSIGSSHTSGLANS